VNADPRRRRWDRSARRRGTFDHGLLDNDANENPHALKDRRSRFFPLDTRTPPFDIPAA
jgi:hypothetical protein